MKKTSRLKIVMVGGGSYNWSPRLISDIIHEPALEGSEIMLLDPDTRASSDIKDAATTMASVADRKFTFRTTVSQATAFRDADFIIITISTGGYDSMQHDIAIPEKYGIYQTVGDTVGPGGWSRSLRNIPVFEKMAAAIERYAPRAVVLNYTNPMASLTATFQEVSSLRTVGLCHGVFSNYEVFCKLFKCKEEDIAMTFGGVNHFFWVLDFSVKGKPGYPMLRRKLGKRSMDQVLSKGETDAAGFHSRHALCNELYRNYQYLPYVADRHTCEFLPGFITPAPASLKKFNLVRTSIKLRRSRRKDAIKRAHNIVKKKKGPYPRSRETAVNIIKAAAFATPFCDVVNLPNTGQIDNLPRGAIVETLGLIDGLGFRAVNVGSLPEPIRQLVHPHCVVQQLTLEAALTGSKRLAMEALISDPVCSHLAPSRIRQMGEDLMQATRKWLPRFK